MSNEVHLLAKERWSELSDIFATADSDVPNTEQANIIAKCDDENNIEAFVVVEHLLRVGQIWNTGDKSIPLQFIRYLEKNIPVGSSVIVIASDERYEGLCEKLGMREVKGKLFRKDF